VELMFEHGAVDELRREYDPGSERPIERCLAAYVRASRWHVQDAAPVWLEIERRWGANACTSALAATHATSMTPRPAWVSRGLEFSRRATKLAPELAEVWGAYAAQLHILGRHDEERPVLLQGIAHATHARDHVYLRATLASNDFEHGDTVRAAVGLRAVRAAVARDGRPGLWAIYLSREDRRLLAPRAGDRDPGRAATHAVESLAEIARRHSAWPVEFWAQWSLGQVRFDELGDAAGAVGAYDRAVEIADSVRRAFLASLAYVKRGRALARMARTADAERDLRHGLSLAKMLGDAYWVAEGYHNLAHLHEGAGRLTDAARAANEFIRWSRQTPHAPIHLMSFRDAGMIRWKAGWHAAADSAFAEMVRVIERQQREHFFAGEYFERIGRLGDALRAYRLGLLSDRTPARPLAALARVFDALGMPDSAEATAREHDRQLGLGVEGVPLLPALLARRGETAAATRIARQWAEMRIAQGNAQTAAATLRHLAELLLEVNNAPDALREAVRAESLAVRLNLTDEVIRARRIEGLARLRLGERDRAVARLSDAARLATAHPTAEGVLQTQLALGTALASLGRVDQALAAYDRAAAAVERVTHHLATDLDRARYRERQLAPFDGALRALSRLPESTDRLSSLLAWSGRRKAAALALDAGTAARGAGDAPAGLTLQRLQQRLRERQALIDYVVVDSAILAIVVTSRAAQVIRLPTSVAEVRAWAAALRRPLVTTYAGRVDLGRAPFDLRRAHALHRALLAPLDSLLRDVDRLFIAPDGVLHYVPFDALVHEAPSTRTGRDAYRLAQYVIDRFEIVLLPTSSILDNGLRRGRGFLTPSDRVLAVLHATPGGAREIDDVARAWGPSRVTILNEPRSTETAVREAANGANGFAVLHLATHARADDRDPLASHLSLGADERNDGFYHLSEIASERRHARLVVLSACETMTGRLYAGEGFMGLARAFLASGASMVVASQWPVGPTASALFGRFYASLASSGSPGAALHAAKRALRQQSATAHPFHWASFVLIARGASG
jgi:CHAT domain-containing protein